VVAHRRVRATAGNAMQAGLSQPRIEKEGLGMQLLLGSNLWDREVATDFASKAVGDL